MLLFLISLALAAPEGEPCSDQNQPGDLCNNMQGDPGMCIPCGADGMVCDFGDTGEGSLFEDCAAAQDKAEAEAAAEAEGCGCDGGATGMGLISLGLGALAVGRRRREARTPAQ